jgi:hypothetical protein
MKRVAIFGVIFIILIISGFLFLNFSKEGIFEKEECEKYDETIASQEETDISSYKFVCLKGKELILRNEINFDISPSRLKFLNEENNKMRLNSGIETYDTTQEMQALKCGLKFFEEDFSYQSPYNSFLINFGTVIFSGNQLRSLLKSIIPEKFDIQEEKEYTLVLETKINGKIISIQECSSYFDNRAKMIGLKNTI